MRFWETVRRVTLAGCFFAGLAAIAWTAWPSISNWHRERLALELVDRVAAAPDAKVEIPLRQLAKLGTAAIKPLVASAASRRAAVAELAQQILNERYESWRIRASSSDEFDLQSRADLLADALAAHIDQFGSAGLSWAERIVLRILRDSEGFSARQLEQVLKHCNEVLVAIPPVGPRMRNLSAYPKAPTTAGQRRIPPPRVELGSLAIPRKTFPQATALDASLGIQSSDQSPPNTRFRTPSPARPPEVVRRPSEDWAPQWSDTGQRRPSTPSTKPELAVGENASQDIDELIDVPSPTRMNRLMAQLRQIPSNELLRQWKTAGRYQSAAILEVLRQQGSTDAELALLPRLMSDDAAVRVQSIEDLSQLPAAAARRWLHRLLDDTNAEVRLRALTAIATTNDPRLLDLAHRRAVEDKDRRVADLASKILRERVR